jgi:hypothetical protein
VIDNEAFNCIVTRVECVCPMMSFLLQRPYHTHFERPSLLHFLPFFLPNLVSTKKAKND